MVEVYNLIDKIKNHFENDTFVNTVTFGRADKIDLAKTTIFPLADFFITNATMSGNKITFTVYVIILDIVDQSKATPDDFYGNTDEQDIMNNTLGIMKIFLKSVEDSRGALAQAQYVMEDEDPECELIYEEQENVLIGWATTIDISVPNTTSIC